MKRRAFLQGAGGVVVAAPFLSSARRFARAQEDLPRRAVFFHTHGGCVTPRWFPEVENGQLTSEALNKTNLAPLAPMADKLLLPRGITAINGLGRPQTVDPHVQAMASKLTCAPLDLEAQLPTSHSIDHELARQVNTLDPLPLVLRPGFAFEDVRSYLSYSGPLTPQPWSNSLPDIYARILGQTPRPQDPSAEREALRQDFLLDVVRDDLMRLRANQMSQTDSERLDAWADLLFDTRNQILTVDEACVSEGLSELGLSQSTLEGAELNPTAEGSPASLITKGGDAMMKLIALSMMCDTNRAFVFSYPGTMTFSWDGIDHDYDIDGLNHRTGSAAVGSECVDGVLEMLEEVDRWNAGKFFQLISLLDSIPEGEGTLLDQSACTWLSEFSDGGQFNVNNMPLLMAGSAGGYLKQGQAVLLEDEPVGGGNSDANCTTPGDLADEFMGTDPERGLVPINKLYVTLMNALGCTAADGGPVSEFGVFDGPSIEEAITDPGELDALRS